MSVQPPSEFAVDSAFKWVGSIGVAAVAIRQAFKTFKADQRDDKIIESEIKHIERMGSEIEAKRLLIENLESQLNEIRQIELQGAPDIAIIGVYLEQLKERDCTEVDLGKCPALDICEHLEFVYERITQRREQKAQLLNRRKEDREPK